MDTSEPSVDVLRVRLVREMDPYAIPVTSIGRYNRLAVGYANKSLRTRLTTRARDGISDDETTDSSSDAPKVVAPVSDLNSATEPHGSSVRLAADLTSDDNSRRIPLAPSDEVPVEPDAELLPERVPTFAPLVSRPPETPAGRLVLCRLPGRFPHIHSAARTTAKDRTAPSSGEPLMLFRIRARLGRLFRRVLAVLTSADRGASALLLSPLMELRAARPPDLPSADELSRRFEGRHTGCAA